MTYEVTVECRVSVNGQPLWSFKARRGFASKADLHRLVVAGQDESISSWAVAPGLFSKSPGLTFHFLGVSTPIKVDSQDVDRGHVWLERRGSRVFFERGEVSAKAPTALNSFWKFVSAPAKEFTLRPDGIHISAKLGGVATLGLLTARHDETLFIPNPSQEPLGAGPLDNLLNQLRKLQGVSVPSSWAALEFLTAQLKASDVGVVIQDSTQGDLLTPKPNRSLVLSLPTAAVRFELTDQRRSSPLPAQSRLPLVADEVRAEFENGTLKRVLVRQGAAAQAKPEEHKLTMVWEPTKGDELALPSSALAVSNNITQRLQTLRQDGTVKRAMMPVAEGWLQLELPSTIETDERAETEGGWEIGTRRLERHGDSKVESLLPFAVRAEGLKAFEVRVDIEPAPKIAISKLTTTLVCSRFGVRGLIWLGVGRADDDDLLPRLELGADTLRDLEFTSAATAAAWHVGLAGLTVKQGIHQTWPELACDRIDLSRLGEPVVLWTRHPQLPAISVMPLTATRDAAPRALSSRELLPMKLTGTAINLKLAKDAWPSVLAAGNGASLAFWWPQANSTSAKPGDKHRPTDQLPWASLTLPGLELWLDGKQSYRIDLPYVDERYAAAQPPPQDRAVSPDPDTAQNADPTDPRITPPRSDVRRADLVLGDDEGIQQMFLQRLDAWKLALGADTTLFDSGLSSDSGALLRGYDWLGSFSAKMKANDGLGEIRIQDGIFAPSLSGNDALAGLTASPTLADRTIALRAEGDDLMLGWSLPMLKRGNERVDADGTRSSVDDTHIAGPDGDQYSRYTLQKPIAFTCAGIRCEFWCRELPVRESVDSAKDFDPDARATALGGYEWRLYRSDDAVSAERIPLSPHFELIPLRLRQFRHAGDQARIRVEGELHAVHDETAGSLGTVEVVLDSSRPDAVQSPYSDEEPSPPLHWPIRLQSGMPPLDLPRRPWLRFHLGTSLSPRQCRVHIPLFGDWQALDVEGSPASDSTLQFKSNQTGLVLGLGHEHQLTLSVAFTSSVVEGTIKRDAKGKHAIELTRFPGLASGETYLRELSQFELLRDAGFGLNWVTTSNFSLANAVTLGKANQHWALGMAMSFPAPAEGAANARVLQVYLEGTVISGQAARLDLLWLDTRSDSETNKPGESSFALRIKLRQECHSLIDWPKVEVTPEEAKPDLTIKSIGRRSSFTVLWDGECLTGKHLSVNGEGVLSFTPDVWPSVRCEHQIDARNGGRGFKTAIFHPVFIGTAGQFADSLNVDIRFNGLFGEVRRDELEGFYSKAFRTTLASKMNRDAGVIAGMPLLLLDQQPVVFPVLHVKEKEVEDALRIAMGHSKASLTVKQCPTFDSRPVVRSESTVGIEQLRPEQVTLLARSTDFRQAITPAWAHLNALSSQSFEPLQGYEVVLDQRFLDKHFEPAAARSSTPKGKNWPLLRSQAWLSKVLDASERAKDPVAILALAAQRGRWMLYDPATLVTRTQAASIFASTAPTEDLVVGGRDSVGMLPARNHNDKRWLTDSIATIHGAPAFAFKRARSTKEVATEIEAIPLAPAPGHLHAPGTSVPSTAISVHRGPPHAPQLQGERLLTETIRTELLYRRPINLPKQAARGTSHFYRSALATDMDLRHRSVEDVSYGATRPNAQAYRDLRETLPAVMTTAPSSTQTQTGQAVTSTQQDEADSMTPVLYPYRESIVIAQRSGVLRHRREAIAQYKDDQLNEHGRSLAHGLRGPRPPSLPDDRRCLGILDGSRSVDAFDGLADVLLLHDLRKESQKAMVTRVAMEQTVLPASWRGELRFSLEQKAKPDWLPGVAVPNEGEWQGTLHLDGRILPFDVVTQPSRRGNQLVLSLSAGSELGNSDDQRHGLVRLSFSSSQGDLPTEPSSSIEMPIVVAARRRFNLPMRVHTLTFVDKIYNDALTSRVAGVRVDVSGTDHGLYADRHAYESEASMVVMSCVDATLSLERLRPGSERAETLTLGTPPKKLDVKGDTPVRISLGELRIASRPNEPAVAAGDIVRVRSQHSTLLLHISARPVFSPPDAAYALLCSRDGKVHCASYGVGIVPERVVLINPVGDLKAGRLRRLAIFRWHVVRPSWESSNAYYVQRIDQSGATYIPTPDEFSSLS